MCSIIFDYLIFGCAMELNSCIKTVPVKPKVQDVNCLDMVSANSACSEKLNNSECEYNIRLYCYEWTVSDFSFLKSFPTGIVSSDFLVGKNDELFMKLRLVPQSERNTFKVQISLTRKFKFCSENDETFRADEVKLEFLDSKGKVLDYFLLRENCAQFSDNIIWVKEENMSRFIENDTLKFRANVSLRYDTNSEKRKSVYSKKSIEILAKDMKELTDCKLFPPDLSIYIAGHRFFAHKCVLLPQFPFVAKLVSESDCSKSSENLTLNPSDMPTDSICIPNEKSEVFKSVLDYLYYGKVFVGNTVNDFDLYAFAKKYQLHELSRQLKPREMHLCTQTQKKIIEFGWHVKNYSVQSLEKFHLFQSSLKTITVGTRCISWCICLFYFDSESIFLSLKRIDEYSSEIQAAFRLMICLPDGTPHETHDFQHIFKKEERCPYPGFLDPESRFSLKSDLLFDDSFIVRCEITVCEDQMTSSSNRIYPEMPQNFEFKMWLRNLRTLLDTGNFSDVSLLVAEAEFKAHKSILSARSPVFAKMFETNMEEKIHNIVKIEDISETTLKCALTYMYTGTLDILTMKEAPELYRTADKYEILDLKERCSEFILDNMDIKHACEVLILSDLFNDDKMKKAAKDLICRNAAQSFLNDDGRDLMLNHPHLARSVLDDLSAAYCSLPSQDFYLKCSIISDVKNFDIDESSIVPTLLPP